MPAQTDIPMGERVLVLAPTALDAAMTQSLLAEAGLRAEPHASYESLVESLQAHEPGAVLLTDMMVINGGTIHVAEALSAQEPWSDIPVVLLAGGGTDSPGAVTMLDTLGNVTVLERPTRVVTLISALRSAIKARRRQYELRDRLIALESAEAVVKSSERQFRRLVETAMEGIWQVDLEGRTTYVNQRLCDMLGFSKERMMHAPLEEFFHPEELEAVRARIRDRERAAGDTNEWRLRRFDQSYITVLSSAAPVRDADGTLLGAFAMMTDISDRKVNEDALRDATKRKDEFIAVLAHELRNPLAPIRSSLQILRFHHEPDTAASPILDILDRQVTHMVHLVDELLEISRISTGVIELHKKTTLLSTVIDTAVEASSPNVRAAGHNLRLQLPKQSIRVDVDAVRLAQVLTNLLNNAAKYSGRGGQIVLSVCIIPQKEDGSILEIIVTDTGVGIAKEHLSKVFEMFSQIDRTSGRAHQGLGIGLALARNLVQLHGGTIEARSEGIGKGSSFIIQLPIHSDLPDARDESVLAPNTVSSRPLDQRHILVVDDNEDAANSITELLRVSGASVDVAYDGEHALALWRQHHHGTVLLDVGMPVMDGCELARHIRHEPEGKSPTLIALTGWGQSGDRASTSAAGMNYHLVKPIEFDTLRRLLMTLPSEGAARIVS